MSEAEASNNVAQPHSQQLILFLERVQIEPKLSSEPKQAILQLRNALQGLIQLGQAVGQLRNQFLGQAFAQQDTNIIDLTDDETIVKLEDAPISGWDFTTNVFDASGQQLFEPEFVERVAYLLAEVADADSNSSAHAALLSVDRLDLLLTLARSEAQRLVEVLHQLKKAN